MAIPYVVRKKVSVLGGERKELWHAVAKKLQKKGGGLTIDDLADIIASRSGFGRGDITGMLTDLTSVIEDALGMGRSVHLKGLGTIQTALTSKGFEDPAEITPSQVRLSRVYFIADRQLTQRLRKIPCTRVPSKGLKNIEFTGTNKNHI